MDKERYLSWQQQLKERKYFRWFWVASGIYSIAIYGIIGVYFLYSPNGWKVITLIGIAGLFTHYVICKLIHLIYPKPHPYQELQFGVITSKFFSLSDSVRDSFPSEHSATTAAISIVIFMFSPILGLVSLAIVLLIGWARNVLGYHDPWDVLGGIVIGLLTGYGCYLLVYPRLFT